MFFSSYFCTHHGTLLAGCRSYDRLYLKYIYINIYIYIYIILKLVPFLFLCYELFINVRTTSFKFLSS